MEWYLYFIWFDNSRNLDDDTQLALALSASMLSDAADDKDLGGKKKRKKKEK